MEMVLLAAYAVPSINLFVPTYACFFCFCGYIALAGWSCIARLCRQVLITYWCKGKGDRVTNILDHLAIDEKCLWISFSLIFFFKLFWKVKVRLQRKTEPLCVPVCKVQGSEDDTFWHVSFRNSLCLLLLHTSLMWRASSVCACLRVF